MCVVFLLIIIAKACKYNDIFFNVLFFFEVCVLECNSNFNTSAVHAPPRKYNNNIGQKSRKIRVPATGDCNASCDSD